MKKLFLASYFAYVSDLLFPLLSKEPRYMKVAFITTAANLYTIKPLWYLGDRLKLVQMGFQVVDIDLKHKTKAKLEKELNNFDVIFVCGGNTYYLLEWVQKSGFAEVVAHLISKGVIYVGSSAGSALACKTIEHIEDLDDRSKATLTSYTGLGFTQKLIIPHFGDKKIKDETSRIIEKWDNGENELALLNNNQVLVIEGDREQVVTK